MDYSNFGNNRRRRQLNSQTTRVRNKIALMTLRVSLALILMGGFAVTAMGLGIWLGIIQAAPSIDFDHITPGIYSSFIIDNNTGEVLHVLHGGVNRESVTIDEISRYMIDAIVAIEDERFFQHNGVDIRGIGRALNMALTSDAGTQGASTITQQLIKNIHGFFEGELVWKLQEQYLAIQFERHVTELMDGCRLSAKYFILQLYLNQVSFGRQNYGVQAAAMFYFGVYASELTLPQAAVIAAITQNPVWLAPDRHQEANWRRAQLVLDRMLFNGFITEEQHFEAMTSDVYSTLVADGTRMAVVSTMSCFHDAIVEQLRDDLMELYGWSPAMAYTMIFEGGLRIYSVQDLAMQEVVDRHFMNPDNFPQQDFRIHIYFYLTVQDTMSGMRTNFTRSYLGRSMEDVEAFKDRIRAEVAGYDDVIVAEFPVITLQPQAAFVLLDHTTGHVLALRGIRGEKLLDRAFCRATEATRSPGSQLKPIAAFAPAFDMGWMVPSTVIDDIPIIIGHEQHRVTNWYRQPPYEGLNTARRAIYRSGNVTSTRTVLETVGIPTMWRYMQNFGFTTIRERYVDRHGTVFTDMTYGLPLGSMTHGVILLELAAAYGTVANGGLYNRPILYSRVVDRHGNVIIENHHEPRRVLRATTAYMLIDAMRDTVSRTGATGHSMNWQNNAQLRNDIPVAGKTGTSNDRRDLGFTGFTPHLTAAIWMGNDDNRPMSTFNVGGMAHAGVFHGPLWRNIMQEIHEWDRFEPRQFVRPPGIVTGTVCLDSGMLMSSACQHDPRGNRGRSEIFTSDTLPTEECDVHQAHLMCTAHNRLASLYCTQTAWRSGIVRPVPIPEEFAGTWINDRQFELHSSVRDGIYCTACAEGPPPWVETDGWYLSEDYRDWPPDMWPYLPFGPYANQNQPQRPPEPDPDYAPVYDATPPDGHDQLPPWMLPPFAPAPTEPPTEPPTEAPHYPDPPPGAPDPNYGYGQDDDNNDNALW
ncbi:MAG: transglycosylase domain-containing protein [Defluviitaleaceae bacterium]|nr:transglycosylase domain-containing protein [Defluviitaleaceae bacterium]